MSYNTDCGQGVLHFHEQSKKSIQKVLKKWIFNFHSMQNMELTPLVLQLHTLIYLSVCQALVFQYEGLYLTTQSNTFMSTLMLKRPVLLITSITHVACQGQIALITSLALITSHLLVLRQQMKLCKELTPSWKVEISWVLLLFSDKVRRVNNIYPSFPLDSYMIS